MSAHLDAVPRAKCPRSLSFFASAYLEALVRALGVHGTPAFLVNDQMIAGADTAALERAIAAARSGAPSRLGPMAAGR